MNILFIINSLEKYGGTERVAVTLANDLSGFYKVTVLSKDFNSEKNAYTLEGNIDDIKFPNGNFVFLKKCKEYIDENKPCIVMIHTMSKLTPILLLAGMKAKRTWSIEHISYDFHSILFRVLRNRLYKKLDRVITLTYEDSKNYQNIADKVSVIPNSSPLSIRKSTNSSDSKIIVSIGRLTYQKGYDLLIKAWLSVERLHYDWMLHLYGEGEDKEKLERMIMNYGIKNIVLKGLTNDVQAVYDSAAFYVMSSRYEGFGMVLIEAQSRGLPIVSFDCPSGPSEIVNDGVDGYLVDNGDVEHLSRKISYLIQHPNIRKFFSKNALVSARRFESKAITQNWIDLIKSDYHG